MKNVITVNSENEFNIELISQTDNGGNSFFVEVKCDLSKNPKITNAAETFEFEPDTSNSVCEIPEPLWVGLGESEITISDDETSKTYTIKKAFGIGNNYAIKQVDDNTLTFTQQSTINAFNYDSQSEQIVGRWINGKAIYRRFIAVERSATATSFNVNIQALNIEDIINIGGFGKRTSDNAVFTAMWNENPANANNARLYVYPQLNNGLIQIYNYYSPSTMTVWIEYTKTTDESTTLEPIKREESELKDEFTLIWEGDAASDQTIELPESMLLHKEIAVQLRNVASTTANGWSSIFRVPTAILKEYYPNPTASTAVERCMLSQYDNYSSYISYVSDTQVFFDFNTTSRLRRIWFVD